MNIRGRCLHFIGNEVQIKVITPEPLTAIIEHLK